MCWEFFYLILYSFWSILYTTGVIVWRKFFCVHHSPTLCRHTLFPRDSACAIQNELWTFFCSYSKFLFSLSYGNYLLLILTDVKFSPCLRTDRHCRITLALLRIFQQWVLGCYLLSSFHQVPSLSTIRLCCTWSVETTTFMKLRGPIL